MESRIQELERRMKILEGAVFPAQDICDEDQANQMLEDTASFVESNTDKTEDHQRIHFASLIGRLFMGLAGAFLLRAAVDDGMLPSVAGFGAGLAYALGWLGWADRCRSVSGSRRGLVSGFLAALIAYPLLLESGVTMHFVQPEVAIIATGLVTAAFMIVAVRLDRQSLAMISIIGAIVVGMTAYWGTEAKTTSSLMLIIIAVLAAVISQRMSWQAPQWIASTWANFILVILLLHASGLSGQHDGFASMSTVVLFLAAGQCVLFLGLFSRAIINQLRPVGSFEVVQTLVSLALGFGAAMVSARESDTMAFVIGLVVLSSGAALYLYSFFGVQRSHGKEAEFYYHSTLALLFVLSGAAFLPSGGFVGTLWMGLALMMSLLGARRHRLTLRYHGAAVTLTTILATGVLWASFPPLTANEVAPLMDIHRLVVTTMVICCGWVLFSTSLPGDAVWTRRFPTTLVFGVSAILGAGLLAQSCMLFFGDGEVLALGLTAVVRTLAGCVTVMILMILVRILNRPEFGWLVVPLLIALGGKLIFEDLGVGSSGIRFIGFLSYGALWIAAAGTMKILRRET